METSKFKFNPANLGVAKIGLRSSNESYPEIIAKQTPAQFGMNGRAAELLGAKPGDYVVFFPNGSAENLGEQFLVAIAPKGYAGGAKLATGSKNGNGRALSFSWQSIWSIVQQQDLEAKELNNEGLLKDGIVEKTSKSYVAKQRISYKLEEVDLGGEGFTDEDGNTFEKLFVLTDPQRLDPIVRSATSEDGEEEESDDFSVEVED